ncbi:hypothetical protein BU23DRAFT_299508 [Bimuria novae-zelandiae CBS 107.79]|uniref:Uncharacterized protein n=1 Tax=Bimuria novae-zelandiae CBS 107.79 TaxID=1447943 RepID=A0A6A5VM01_9PLEO|nr:hypothetical protein BU23DRAFT_299508 [Bimuria novae-zelandiae CBS 107.79]
MRSRSIFSALSFVFTTCTTHALPDPCAEPEANPEAQNYNYQPFSGAIYVVDSNGQPAQGSCPASAALSCGDQGYPSWCCPGGYTCVQPQNQNGYIGCCPAGQTCGGAVYVSTVTINAQAQTTVPAVVVPLAFTTTATYIPPPTVGGYCQTLTMNGPDLPRVTQGQCGTILIVSGSLINRKPLGFVAAGTFLLGQLAIARMFRWI